MSTASSPIPMVCAWGPLGLLELQDGTVIWGGEFELRGASGFQAQHRHRGVCGVKAEVEVGADVRFRVLPGEHVDVWACHETGPTDLEPHLGLIQRTFQESVHELMAKMD